MRHTGHFFWNESMGSIFLLSANYSNHVSAISPFSPYSISHTIRFCAEFGFVIITIIIIFIVQIYGHTKWMVDSNKSIWNQIDGIICQNKSPNSPIFSFLLLLLVFFFSLFLLYRTSRSIKTKSIWITEWIRYDGECCAMWSCACCVRHTHRFM